MQQNLRCCDRDIFQGNLLESRRPHPRSRRKIAAALGELPSDGHSATGAHQGAETQYPGLPYTHSSSVHAQPADIPPVAATRAVASETNCNPTAPTADLPAEARAPASLMRQVYVRGRQRSPARTVPANADPSRKSRSARGHRNPATFGPVSPRAAAPGTAACPPLPAVGHGARGRRGGSAARPERDARAGRRSTAPTQPPARARPPPAAPLPAAPRSRSPCEGGAAPPAAAPLGTAERGPESRTRASARPLHTWCGSAPPPHHAGRLRRGWQRSAGRTARQAAFPPATIFLRPPPPPPAPPGTAPPAVPRRPSRQRVRRRPPGPAAVRGGAAITGRAGGRRGDGGRRAGPPSAQRAARTPPESGPSAARSPTLPRGEQWLPDSWGAAGSRTCSQAPGSPSRPATGIAPRQCVSLHATACSLFAHTNVVLVIGCHEFEENH